MEPLGVRVKMVLLAIYRLLVAMGLTLTLWAQTPATVGALSAAQPPAVPAPPNDPLGRGTPRGTVVNFLRAVSADDYKRAAKYLQTNLPDSRAEHLAMELGTVLNRRFRIETESLSNQADGNPTDDSQPNRDLIGVIESPGGPVEVALERVSHESEPRMIWLFSAETLKEIPHLYAGTGGFWMESYVPEQLKAHQLLGIPLWRWLLWVLGLCIALGGSALLQSLLRLAWPPLLRRLDPDQSQPVGLALSGPLRVFLFSLFVMFLSSFAATILARQFWFRAGATVAVFSGGWMLSRIVDSAATIAAHRLQRRTGVVHSSTIWLMQRAGKFVIALVGILCLLKLGDIQLTGLLAGLGIGGLALAFAAKTTIENLFGGVMITIDGSLRVGDTCRIGDVTGTIVDIGIRSTRIRTLNRTVVSIPNGQTAIVSIENFSERDKYHFLHVIGVRYETDVEAMRGVLEAIRELMAGFSEVEPETLRVRMIRFGASSLDIELRAYLFAASFDDFLESQERLLLAVMETLSARGVGIAFPSQTVYMTKGK